ncbi:hypothetical protein GCM10011375_35410 [Hymenobacter qilianensis]|uniref:Uncharacterized protein n=2 Tax=Hymenobacter qilianensis TaxID=1385715 RepID=A0ACB5PVV6_9BACT|nr:hypothetical protein [Hymenobacter qilianensis]QNP51221.1 hypothetical protein H9L05_14190 [Hymenobacter qilianensis]GGF77255.1 hypothetical protein GCM10011375_35410 [Hymenobacter qilianensis]
MYKLTAPVRRRVAASLLGVFLSVFAVQFLCLCFGVQARSLPQHLAVAAEQHSHAAGTSAHSHNTHEHKATAHHHDQDQASGDEQGQKDECCRDKTSTFFASLTHPPKLSLDKAMSPLYLALPPASSFALAHFEAWDRTMPVLLVPPAHLKPKIPDIRVFIGSLTI